MNSVMPANKVLDILSFILLLAVYPMGSNCPNPVDFCVRSADKGGVSVLIELLSKTGNSTLPMLGVFDLHNEDSLKDKWCRRHLHYLNDGVRNATVGMNTVLWVDYVAFTGREEEGEDTSPRPIPYILGSRDVHGIVLQ